MIPIAAMPIKGRAASGIAPRLPSRTLPRTMTMRNGLSNISFDSGARSNDRKLARATAEACSDSQGSLLSKNTAGAGSGLATTLPAGVGEGAERLLPDVSWPVYRRRMVRYDRQRLAAPMDAMP